MSTNGFFRTRFVVALSTAACALFTIAPLARAADKSGSPKSAKQVIIGPSLGVYGGWGADPFNGPYMFSWQTFMHFYGGNWRGNSRIKVHLHGPMNNPTIQPTDRVILTLFTDSFGSVDGSIENTSPEYMIPYDNGQHGVAGANMPDIICPGHYQVVGYLDDPIIAQVAAVEGGVNILPHTIPTVYPTTYPSTYINWGFSRGQRFGFMDDHSPEYLDPEWTTVWSKAPIQLYGTLADTDDDGNNQPTLIAHHETPSSHYAHDGNMMVLPDPEYSWVLGTANTQGDPEESETRRLELEWELQNDYSPNAYQRGVVGMPLWMHGSAGDRIFTVGTWALDGGHRGHGFRTEIHPPRFLAVMRKHPTTVSFQKPECLIPALEVDVLANGHGGGINQSFYQGLEDLLDNHGKGGGRMEDYIASLDVVDHPIWDVYYRYGPGGGDFADLISLVYGLTTGADIYERAGPSAIGTDDTTGLPAIWDYNSPPPPNIHPWGLGPEETPINDMDYDFDVFLPAPPPGATAPQVLVETRPENSTSVVEQISFTDPNPNTGLPTKAHVHVPCKGGDSLVYAKTYKFSWNVYSWPGRRFVVKINDFTFFDPDDSAVKHWNDFTGKQQFWADVNGTWKSLTDMAPDQFLSGVKQKIVRFGDSPPTWEVYLKGSDQLRLFTYGYERCSLEDHFVTDIGMGAYQAAAQIAGALIGGTGDNKKRGGALFSREENPIPLGGLLGPHFMSGGYTSSGFEDYTSGYTVGFNVTYLPNPHADVAPSSLDFGDVVLGSNSQKTIHVKNLAENFGGGGFSVDVLHCNLSLSGDGYSVSPDSVFNLYGGDNGDLTVKFAPTVPGQGTGSLMMTTDDVCNPTISIPFKARVLYPEIGVSVPENEMSPTVVGCSSSKTITVSNTGTSDLVFKPEITGTGYSFAPYTADASGQITVGAGSSTTLVVNFAPTALTRGAQATLKFTSNDPINPVKYANLCGEGVRSGMRVLVLKAGVPYPKVDQMTITSNGKPPISINNKNLALQSIPPPTTCHLIQYHMETALPSTNPTGPPTSQYTIKAKVGNSSKSVTITLGPCEFKVIYITLP